MDTEPNPFHPHHQHTTLMATDWPQVECFVLRRRAESLAEAATGSRRRPPCRRA